MMAKMKAFFAQELEKDICPWRDLAEGLFFALKNTQLFKEEKVLVKVKQTEKAEATFKFKVFFLKRPQFYPNFNANWMDAFYADWTDPEIVLADTSFYLFLHLPGLKIDSI